MAITDSTHRSRHYRIMGRDGAQILADLRQHLSQQVFYRELAIFEKSGGRSGDLGEEIMEFELHVAGSEGGMTFGALALYSIVDHSANGYAHLASVLVNLPPEHKALEPLLKYLQDARFVSDYSSFKERPQGHKRFLSYLDEMPDLSNSQDFHCDDGRGVRKRTARAA